MSTLIISFTNPDIMQSQPWPVAIDTETGKVLSGLGNDDGALLIGFGTQGAQSVDVFFTPGADDFDGEEVEGLVPTFSSMGGFFEWGTPIREAMIKQEISDKHLIIDIQMSNDAAQTGEELAEILRAVVAQIEQQDEGRPIFDLNGNTVGTWEYKEVVR